MNSGLDTAVDGLDEVPVQENVVCCTTLCSCPLRTRFSPWASSLWGTLHRNGLNTAVDGLDAVQVVCRKMLCAGPLYVPALQYSFFPWASNGVSTETDQTVTMEFAECMHQ